MSRPNQPPTPDFLEAVESSQQTTGDEREIEEQHQPPVQLGRRNSITGEFISDELLHINKNFKYSLSKARNDLQMRHLKQNR